MDDSVRRRNCRKLMFVGLWLFMEMPPKMFGCSVSGKKKGRKEGEGRNAGKKAGRKEEKKGRKEGRKEKIDNSKTIENGVNEEEKNAVTYLI